MRPMIIGIAGGSACGKTSIVKKLKDQLQADASVIHLDAYYQSYDEYNFEERLKLNFDHPMAFEVPLLREHLLALKEGHPIEMPVYDYVLYKRSEQTITVEAKPLILVEGLFVLFEESLRELFDLCVFVEADSDVRLIRRIRRDILERGRSIESVLKQYEEQVKPMHEAFIEPSRKLADIIIPGGADNKKGLQILSDHLKKQRKKKR